MKVIIYEAVAESFNINQKWNTFKKLLIRENVNVVHQINKTKINKEINEAPSADEMMISCRVQGDTSVGCGGNDAHFPAGIIQLVNSPSLCSARAL